MWIQSLKTSNFRNLSDGTLSLQNGLNFLVGGNGQGKTNTLEAIYFCLTTKSFRVSRPVEMFRDPKQVSKVSCELMRASSHNYFEVMFQDGKCERVLNSKACKPMDFFETAAVLAFTSRSKLLIEGMAEERRRFLDRLICHLEPDYMLLLARFKKVHAQLRQILVGSRDYHVFKSFKKAFIPLAKQIVDKRLNFLNDLNPYVMNLAFNVFNLELPLIIRYKIKNCLDLDYYFDRMLDSCARESQLGRTLMGPHLDDIEITLDAHLSRAFASAGQIRAIVLSMKLAVRELYKIKNGFYPILLLDDIDSELDRDRLLALYHQLQGRGQTLLSSSKNDIILDSCHGNLLYVESGFIRSERNFE